MRITNVSATLGGILPTPNATPQLLVATSGAKETFDENNFTVMHRMEEVSGSLGYSNYFDKNSR